MTRIFKKTSVYVNSITNEETVIVDYSEDPVDALKWMANGYEVEFIDSPSEWAEPVILIAGSVFQQSS